MILTPAFYNADPGRLYEASGYTGKLVVLAVRFVTFLEARGDQVYDMVSPRGDGRLLPDERG